jgi:hypothetical protein
MKLVIVATLILAAALSIASVRATETTSAIRQNRDENGEIKLHKEHNYINKHL